MLTVQDFTADYQKLDNTQLYQIHLNAEDYSDAAKEALAIVILQRGGLEKLGEEIEEQNAQLKEIQRVRQEVIKLAKNGTPIDFLKKIITSNYLPPQKVEDIIENTYKEITSSYENRRIKPRTVVGSMIGGAIASIVGGGLWGLFMVQTHRMIYFFILGLAVLSYGLIKLFTKQSKENLIVLLATVLSVMGALLIGQLIFEQFR